MIIFLIIIGTLFIIWYIVIYNKTRFDNAVFAYKSEYLLALESPGHVQVTISPPIITGKYSTPQLEEIDQKARWVCLGDYVRNIQVNDTLSPKDAMAVNNIAYRLNLNLASNLEVSNYINKLKEYWAWQNEELEIIPVNISLHKDEVCYFQTKIQWHENRTVTDSISYSGVSASFRIVKGVRYRVGSFKPYRQVHNELMQIDAGNLFVTNQRIIFMGAKKNSNIKYDAILSIVPYTDGVGIEKQSGKSPVFVCNNSDILAIVLSRLNK